MEQKDLPFPPPPKPWSPQMEIAACGTNVSIRLDFQVPEYARTKSGLKLKGFRLVRIVRANMIDDEGFDEFFAGDVNRLAQWVMRTSIERVAEREGLPNTAHITYRGCALLRHRPLTAPADNDERWL